MSKILTNDMMKKQLEEIANIPEVEVSEVSELLSPEFIEWDGCILLGEVNDISILNTHFEPNDYYCDRTAYESFANHIHVNDYFPEVPECSLQSLKLALMILDMWESKLKKKFSDTRFHFILSHDELGSVLRFHKYRSEEGTWLNVDNIDGYTEEGILFKEI